jgi:hypothetical protein
LPRNGFLIQERVFALVFAVLHIVADAGQFGHSAFAARSAELRFFAAKNFQTVEKTVKRSAVLAAEGRCHPDSGTAHA